MELNNSKSAGPVISTRAPAEAFRLASEQLLIQELSKNPRNDMTRQVVDVLLVVQNFLVQNPLFRNYCLLSTFFTKKYKRRKKFLC
jgi:hypothetical protein